MWIDWKQILRKLILWRRHVPLSLPATSALGGMERLEVEMTREEEEYLKAADRTSTEWEGAPGMGEYSRRHPPGKSLFFLGRQWTPPTAATHRGTGHRHGFLLKERHARSVNCASSWIYKIALRDKNKDLSRQFTNSGYWRRCPHILKANVWEHAPSKTSILFNARLNSCAL